MNNDRDLLDIIDPQPVTAGQIFMGVIVIGTVFAILLWLIL